LVDIGLGIQLIPTNGDEPSSSSLLVGISWIPNGWNSMTAIGWNWLDSYWMEFAGLLLV